MQKTLKIIGITLCTLLLLVVLAVGAVVYVVFSPRQLTPVVQRVCDELVAVPHEIGEVNLTLFHTWPHFGLEIQGLSIVNPLPGSPSDTLLAAPKVYVGLDLQQYWNNQTLAVTSIELPDVVLNAFIAADGRTNFNIDDLLRLPGDTTEQAEDSSALVLPFAVKLDRIELQTRQLSFVSCPDSLDVRNLHLHLVAAAAADSTLSELAAEIQHLQLDWDGLCVDAQGFVHIAHMDTVGMALQVQTNSWNIGHVLRTIPAQYARLLPREVSVDGDLVLRALVEGQYGLSDTTLMPNVTATLTLDKGQAAYEGLPLQLEKMSGCVTAFAPLSDLSSAEARIEQLFLQSGRTQLQLQGSVSDLMDDMLLDLQAQGNIHLTDIAGFLPEQYPVTGDVSRANMQARIRLSDVSNMRLKRGLIKGQLALENIVLDTDSMDVHIPGASIDFHIPARNNEHKTTDWLSAAIRVQSLQADLVGTGSAQLGETDIDLYTGDVLSNSSLLYADARIRSTAVNGTYEMVDSLGVASLAKAKILQPDVQAYVEYDSRDTVGLPILQSTLKMALLEAQMDTIEARIEAPKITARIKAGSRNKSQPNISAAVELNHLDAHMGQEMAAQTDHLHMVLTAQQTTKRSNILLEWQPNMNFRILNAHARLAALPDPVHIPEISLHYSNRDCHIDTSRIEMGNSDFSLSGRITNIGPWLEKKGLLKGELNFYSTNADINQLLSYVSGMGNDEAELSEQPDNEEAGEGKVLKEEGDPFIVPRGVDLTLNTHIQKASAFNQELSNLGGRVYIKNGTLIVEEMGFICEAAKLQLTAMYRTPRRNHIYVGLDYHMMDINIAELVNMIPQVDSMLPMLRSFKGGAQFHLAAETYMTSQYQIKPSTCRGACSIQGKDLSLLDGETFTKIAKILTFKKSTENKIDSISAEITLYKSEIDIYPFLISCDRWMGAVGGKHNLDMSFDYHVNLLSPLYIGVGIKGTMDNLSIKPEKCIYAKDFKPAFRRQVDTQSANLRALIRKSLEANIKQ